MTDMSHPSLDGADEFVGLDHLVLPGMDPELLHRVHAALTAELDPVNFIARMWVRDMAIQVARVEYLRMADCAVHRHVQEDPEPAQPEHEGEQGSASQVQPQPRSKDELARAFVDHMALFAGLIQIEQEVMRERDRLIQQYDHRSAIVKAYEDAMAPGGAGSGGAER